MRYFDPYLFSDEDEYYHDFKCYNVIFPNHDNEDMDGEVIIHNLEDMTIIK